MPPVEEEPSQKKQKVEQEPSQKVKEEPSQEKQSIEEESSQEKQSIEEESSQEKQSIEEDSSQGKQSIGEESSQENQSVKEEPSQEKQSIEEESSQEKQSIEEESSQEKQSIKEEPSQEKETGEEEPSQKKQEFEEEHLKEKKKDREELPKEKQKDREEPPKEKQKDKEEPPKEKQKVEAEPPQKKQKVDSRDLEIHSRIEKERKDEGESILDFKFSKKRVEMISKAADVPEDSQGVVYWMSRDQRVQDNWAMLFAQRLAMKNKLSLHVAYCLVPSYLDATHRQYHFLLKGLEEVEKDCQELGIEFHLLLGEAQEVLPEFIKSHNIGGVVTDFCPLRISRQWVKDVKAAIPNNIPMCKVDAHNIVPCWIASDKQEYSAKTIRRKILDKLSTFLTKFPPVIKHPHESKFKAEPVDWIKADKFVQVDRSIEPVEWATPGTMAGLDTLNQFCLKRLRKYTSKSSDPTENALSNLSPWLHFGQVSAQRCVMEVKRYKKQLRESVEDFLEEIIIRRELTDNFCYYQKHYDNIDGAYAWARTTLHDHKEDKRPYLYSRETLDQAKTHDELWNSAQIQLLKEGKMHGFLRMYWAKKILEWTTSPEEALVTAIYINDRYNLDGRDPNGYVGIMWAICGIHDQGWKERPIFGKVRCMNYDGCKRKFRISAFVARYGGKQHKYVPPT